MLGIKPNLGKTDRVLRLFGGVVLIYLGLINSDLIENILLRFLLTGLGLVNIISALLSHCPLYALADIDTRVGAAQFPVIRMASRPSTSVPAAVMPVVTECISGVWELESELPRPPRFLRLPSRTEVARLTMVIFPPAPDSESGYLLACAETDEGEHDRVGVAVPQAAAAELDVALFRADVPQPRSAAHDVDDHARDLGADHVGQPFEHQAQPR